VNDKTCSTVGKTEYECLRSGFVLPLSRHSQDGGRMAHKTYSLPSSSFDIPVHLCNVTELMMSFMAPEKGQFC